MELIQIEYVPLSEVAEWPGNPKEHDVFFLAESIMEHGFNDPIARHAETGRILEGHGRRKALQRLKKQGSVPDGIVVRGGEWHVPVFGLRFDTEAEAEAYMLAHNRAVTRGGWDKAKLAAMFEKQYEQRGNVDGTGFGQQEAEELVARFAKAREQGEAALDFGGGESVSLSDYEPPEVSGDYEVTGTRFVQVFLAADEYDAFTERVQCLKEAYGADNTSDAIQEAVRRAADSLTEAEAG